MTVRKTPVQKRDRDERIASRMINRLTAFIMADFANGPPPPPEPGEKPKKSAFMTDAQVRGALGLLKKYKPDLKSIEVKGDPDHPMVTRITRQILAKPSDPDGGSVPTPVDPE
jgi:hypothetical protein